MIKNERQYRISLAEAQRFEKALSTRPAAPPKESEIHPFLWQAERDALAAQAEELRNDIAAYDALKTGQRRVFTVGQFSDLPRALIEARIASGLTHKDLAKRLRLPQQAIQRYEATDYASAGLERLQQVATAVGVELAGVVKLPEPEPTPAIFFRRLKELGLQRRFVLQRLLSPAVASTLQAPSKGKEFVFGALVQAADTVERIFKISPSTLFGSTPLQIDPSVAWATRFKRPMGGRSRQAFLPRTDGYTMFAHYLALLVLQATDHLPVKRIPGDAQSWRSRILAEFGTLTFENVVRFLWSLGVPVLPLRDEGAFHGACWRTGGRNVIVLKQRSLSEDRWIFDALHEGGHIVAEPDAESFAVVEDEIPVVTNPMERKAMQFAGDIVLNGRADELAERAVDLAGEDVRFLERATKQVAAAAHVSVGALANFLAFRIAEDTADEAEPINWWGTAARLQQESDDPWLVARDILLEHAQLDRLNRADRDLLVRSLTTTQLP